MIRIEEISVAGPTLILYKYENDQLIRKYRKKPKKPEEDKWIEKLRFLAKRGGIAELFWNRIDIVMNKTKTNPDKKYYVAYSFLNDDSDYLDIGLTFDIKTHRKRKNQDEYIELKIGFLARFMMGLDYCRANDDGVTKCQPLYANLLTKEVLKFGKKEGATVVTFHPVSEQSINMWLRLAKDQESPEFDMLKKNPKGLPPAYENRQTTQLDNFNLQFRICSSCNWFAPYTVDHPHLKDKLFFCGQKCLEIKWKNL